MAPSNVPRVSDRHKDVRKRKEKDRRSAPSAARPGTQEATPAKLIIDCKYANELPKPPVPKLLKALPSSDRLCRYTPTALELDHRPCLLTEEDLLARVELVDPDAYGKLPSAGSMPPPLPPMDGQLLKDHDVKQEEKESVSKRQRMADETEASYRQGFPFQFPQLLTNDLFVERQRFATGTFAQEKTVVRDPPPRPTAEQLAQKVFDTFEFAKEPPVHPDKPHLKPKRIMNIVPDAALWANRYRQIHFDELPGKPARNDLLFKSVPNPRTTSFGYFKASDAGETYRLAESYVWENRGGYARSINIGEGETCMLSIPPVDETKPGESVEVRFVLAPPRMRLKKLRANRLDIKPDVSALSVKHRDPKPEEAAEEQTRMATVLSEAPDDDGASEMMVEYVDGEWQLHGRIGTSRGSLSGSQPPTPGSRKGGKSPREHAQSPRSVSGSSRGRAELPTQSTQ